MSTLKIAETNLVSQYTKEELDLITQTVAKGASPQELQLFLYRCKLMGLNPLKPGQIHFVKYGTSPGTIVVGIEGFRSIAGRTSKLSGVKRGVIKEEGKLVGAWAEVYRSDWANPAREEVPFAEYNTGKGPWQKMPETMIKKVAEVAALRMAFPDDLGGIYSDDEMGQAENKSSRISIDKPDLDEGGGVSRDYIIPFGGDITGRKIPEVLRVFGVDKLRRAVELTEEKLAMNIIYKNSSRAEMQEFIDRGSVVIAAFERGAVNENGEFIDLE